MLISRFPTLLVTWCALSLSLACSSSTPRDSAASGGAHGVATGGAGISGSPNTGGSRSGAGGDNTPGVGGGSSGGASQAAGGGPTGSGGTAGSGGEWAGGVGGSSAGSGGAPLSAVSASTLVSQLTIGWNLGNSLDAPEGETAWGNPRVESSLLTAVKEAGFDAVRVPVTWSLHMGEAPDYIIDAEFLARVAEVVSYVREAGLTAIVNVHHDGADDYEGVEWLTLTDANGAISAETNASVEARFIAVWTQLAETFKSADSYVLFESMNEIHDGYDAPDPAYFETINQLNQTFVNIVRASGGNNGERCLVVPGYNTNIDETLAGFKRPNDPTPDRLILSVHYYDPWPFAGEGSTHAWGASSPNADSWGQEDYVAQQFDKLVTSFVSQGLPMIVGEYGAVHQAGYEDERRYYMEHVTKVITDRGIVPFYWDNGSEESGPDGFGLFSRADGSTLYPNVLDAMMRAATSDYSLDEITAPDR